MRLDVNLASQPYQNVRAFLVRWISLLALLLVLTVALVVAAGARWMNSRSVARDIAAKQHEIARLQQEEKDAARKLDLPQNHDIREEAAYINELIAFKAFSWTEAFNELERLMPTRVRVVNVRPQLTSDNQLEVSLSVTSDSRDKALDLLRRLEDSQHFRDAQLRDERLDLQSGLTTFQIYAVYAPSASVAQPAASGVGR